jgi:iron(III) transport system substrate-binding protein
MGLWALLLCASSCTLKRELWVYTNLPKEVIGEMVEPLEEAVPQADVKWYQSASETLEERLNSEMESGKVKADLVLSGDPLWYLAMKHKGQLLSYDSAAAREMPANLRDPDHAFATVRLSVMVLGYNTNLLKPGELPERWKDLSLPRFDRKVSMSSPLESAMGFVSVGFLSKEFGWDYFAALRKQGLVAEGTQSSVLNRIETGERPIGVVLLDSILKAERAKAPVKPIYPLDGPIQIPSSIAILKDTEHPELAQRLYDWFLGPAAQSAIVRGGSYSPFPKIVSPDGARPWNELQPMLLRWTPESLSELETGRDRIRAKFSEVVLH